MTRTATRTDWIKWFGSQSPDRQVEIARDLTPIQITKIRFHISRYMSDRSGDPTFTASKLLWCIEATQGEA